MISEGEVLGIFVALNKPGGFTDADVQLLSIFAGPAASFLRSRQHLRSAAPACESLESVAALAGAMAGEGGRAVLLELVVSAHPHRPRLRQRRLPGARSRARG